MSKLIELDAAIAETWKDTEYTDPLNVMTALRDRLEALPTVDAVPVVRCRDCLYWQKSSLFRGHTVCRYVLDCSVVRREDDFCSRGERKDGDGNG